MGKTLSFFLAVLAVIVIAFLYLNQQPTVGLPESLDDAQKADRCAEFRVVSEEDGRIFSLGYGGRIRQLLTGCF